MASWAKKELARLKFFQSSNRRLLPPRLNSQPSHDNSSTMSQVQELVLAADLRCATCQNKVADAISSIDDMESIVVHVRQKKVTLTRKSTTKSSSTKMASVHLSAAKPSRTAFFSWHK